MVALIHSRQDCGNGVLVDLPAYLLSLFQSVLNAAARLIFRLKSCDHHQPSLVAGSRADPVQVRCHGVQSATWTCTKLPRATCPHRRCVWSSSTPIRRHESHLGAASHVHHRR